MDQSRCDGREMFERLCERQRLLPSNFHITTLEICLTLPDAARRKGSSLADITTTTTTYASEHRRKALIAFFHRHMLKKL